jgi:hypothetical protein
MFPPYRGLASVGLAIENDVPANDARIGPEVIAPKHIAEDDNVTLAWTVIVGRKTTAEERMYTGYGKEVRGDRRALNRFRPFLAPDIEPAATIGCQRLKRAVLALPVEVIRRGDGKQR